MIPTRDEFSTIAGDMTTEYYHTWLLLVILWRNVWRSSTTDWSRYRLRIWDMFAERVRQSARMGRGVDGFISLMCCEFHIAALGVNDEERRAVQDILTLPAAEHRRMLTQLRNNTPVAIAFLRLWRDANKKDLEGENKP